MKIKIFCFNNTCGESDWISCLAIGEDGHVLAQHVCSDEVYLPHDLGITSTCKHEHYNTHFGVDNWELIHVPTSEVLTHPGLLSAFDNNVKLAIAANAHT